MKRSRNPVAGNVVQEKDGPAFIFALSAAACLILHLVVSNISGEPTPLPEPQTWLFILARLALVASALLILMAAFTLAGSGRGARSASPAPPAVEPQPPPMPPVSAPAPFLEYILDYSPLISIQVSRQGTVGRISRTLANLLGTRAGTVEGGDAAELVDSEERPAFRQYLDGHLSGAVTPGLEATIATPAGARKVVFAERHLPIPQGGLSPDILLVGIEVTELRQLEAENDRLRGRLQQAALMEELGLIAGGVAHDIKNIINPVIGYPDYILQSLPPDSDLRQPLTKVRDSARKTLEVILNFLALARRGRFEPVSYNLNNVIDKFVASPEASVLKDRFPGVKLIVDLDPGIPELEGVPAQLNNAVMNLVRNAFEAVEQGRVTVSTTQRELEFPVKGYQQIPRGTYVVLTVADEGKGMSEEHLGHLFEAFFSKKEMGQSGSGLGLAVVAGIVQDHRGYLDVKSREGEGTTFSIYFPAPRMERADRGKEEDLPLALAAAADYETRFQAKNLLGRIGYRVVAASSVEEGSRKVAGENPQVVLVDISGLEHGRIEEAVRSMRRLVESGGALLLAGTLPPGMEDLEKIRLSLPLDRAELEGRLRGQMGKVDESG
ncbi:MAG TPA: ATP-binding protein [bacterium]|nr:ATP-binding protein [bacterium]HPQ65145.1 ATP-binding protein [bacterium]